jgi:hypothetical protein
MCSILGTVPKHVISSAPFAKLRSALGVKEIAEVEKSSIHGTGIEDFSRKFLQNFVRNDFIIGFVNSN